LTVQFVKSRLLKAKLNQQFRDRFEGYEWPETQRKYIGAPVIDGVYTLIDPTEDNNTVTTLATSHTEDDSTVRTTTSSSITIANDRVVYQVILPPMVVLVVQLPTDMKQFECPPRSHYPRFDRSRNKSCERRSMPS
jgi:hypothetical protein